MIGQAKCRSAAGCILRGKTKAQSEPEGGGVCRADKVACVDWLHCEAQVGVANAIKAPAALIISKTTVRCSLAKLIQTAWKMAEEREGRRRAYVYEIEQIQKSN